jgi:hypothetical protein
MSATLRRLAFLLLAYRLVLPACAATWTTGHKKVLIIPIRFTDVAGPSDAPNASGFLSGWGNITNGTTLAEISAFMERQSYGLCTMEFTVLPEIDMGVSYTAYEQAYPGGVGNKFANWGEPGSLMDDIRAKARAAGLLTAQPGLYDSDAYDLDIGAMGPVPGQGSISAGRAHGKGVLGVNFKILAHEICHNLGCHHANGISRNSYAMPLLNSQSYLNTYGDVYCLMGDKNANALPIPPDLDVNPFWKYKLGWLTDASIHQPTTSGVYRVHAYDVASLSPGTRHAIRLPRDPYRTYWLGYRQSITGTDAVWSNNGLEVRFGGENIASTAGNTTLLDMTPGSRGASSATSRYGTMRDAQLAIGRTYSDAEANLHITPLRKAGTSPEALDVAVNIGPFPGNRPPTVTIDPPSKAVNAYGAHTFTATASDPDGDTLSYAWEFDDILKPGGIQSGGTHPDARLCTQASHNWSNIGEYDVRCTVTDMKGHATTATATVTVSGGSAGRLTISGVVRDEHGNPLEGAVVNNYQFGVQHYDSATFVASNRTAADGRYTIHLPVGGGNKTYPINAMYQGYAFDCSCPDGKVAVATTPVANVDFTRIRTNRMLSGAIAVAGRAYNPATDGQLTVSDGTTSFLATGGTWQMSVPDGSLSLFTATSSLPNASTLAYFPNPYRVTADYIALNFDLKIPGAMPETGFATAGAGSDDTVGTVEIPIVMSLPPGTNSWRSTQSVFVWIDGASTAEYGVDYKLAGGQITFPLGMSPAPRSLSLRILHDGMPKTKTLVLKMGVANSVTNLGPLTTFTYVIANPFPVPGIRAATFADHTVSLQLHGLSPGLTHRIQRSMALENPTWQDAAVFPGTTETQAWSEPWSNQWERVYYKVGRD